MVACIHISDALIILPSRDAGGVGLGFLGRSDMSPSGYVSFLQGLQAALAETYNTSATVVIAADVTELTTGVASASSQYGIQRWFATGHSMTGGGAALQDYVRNSTAFSGLILIASFAKRTQRPDVRACLGKANVQPQRYVHSKLSPISCPLIPPDSRSVRFQQVTFVSPWLPRRRRASVQRSKHSRLSVADPHHRGRARRGPPTRARVRTHAHIRGIPLVPHTGPNATLVCPHTSSHMHIWVCTREHARAVAASQFRSRPLPLAAVGHTLCRGRSARAPRLCANRSCGSHASLRRCIRKSLSRNAPTRSSSSLARTTGSYSTALPPCQPLSLQR